MRQQFRDRETGQGLVEFALLLPAFILAVMMIVDIGRAVYYYSAIYNAAREGARYGATDPTSPGKIANAARGLASGIQGNMTVTSQCKPNCGSGNVIEVTVVYNFTAATPFLGRLTGSPGNNVVLRSTATMQLER